MQLRLTIAGAPAQTLPLTAGGFYQLSGSDQLSSEAVNQQAGALRALAGRLGSDLGAGLPAGMTHAEPLGAWLNLASGAIEHDARRLIARDDLADLERREDELDRRVKRVRVTADGRAIAKRIRDALLAGLEDFAASLTPDQLSALHEALRAIEPSTP